jgi:hypothetical protein
MSDDQKDVAIEKSCSSSNNSSIFIPEILPIFNQPKLPPNLLDAKMENKFEALNLSLGTKV